jgi:uncharacterized protein (DUF362 family)
VRAGADDSLLAEAVRTAAEAATDFSWLSAGDAVFVKPASNSRFRYPATTHPLGIRTMVALLKEKGAGRVVVGDMSGIQSVKLTPRGLRGSSRRLMRSNGIADAALESGAELCFPEEDGWDAFFEEEPGRGRSWKSGIMMPKVLREVDHVVLLPRCSRHTLAGATLGMKAAVGYWRTDTRLEYHRDAATLHEKTAEANTVPTLKEKQRLVLTVADRVQASMGPDFGFTVRPEAGIVLASESLVAHDMVSLAWLLECRSTVPYVHRHAPLDPHESRLIVDLGNRWVVELLGGAAAAARAETLCRNPMETIWDNRTLQSAFTAFGGVPLLEFDNANATVPREIVARLAAHTSPPPA